jgi:prevent-host-death family protein
MRLVCRKGGAMLDVSRDIHSLTDFKRNTPEFLKRLRETGEAVVLTINGKAALVVQDARSYQKLRVLAQRLETISRRLSSAFPSRQI